MGIVNCGRSPWPGRVVALIATLSLTGASVVLAAGPDKAGTRVVAAPPAILPSVTTTSVAPATGGADISASTLSLNNRPVVTFRSTLLGRAPAERVAAGQASLKIALDKGGPALVTVWPGNDTIGIQLDGTMVFYLVADDLEPADRHDLQAAAEQVRERLQQAAFEVRERTNPRQIGQGLAYSLVASVLMLVAIRLVFMLRRRAVAALQSRLERRRAAQPDKSLVSTYAGHFQTGLDALITLGSWAVTLLLVNIWASLVLRQFAYTRAWGERSEAWLLEVGAYFAAAIAGAVPGLLIAALIFFIARLVHRANSAFMGRVERGDLSLGWLDSDTAGPTRRVSNFVIWLFALAIAYPFLPGSDSEAFKGVSVLAGLMLSIGASGIVNQIMSGLSLMYSRSLRVGEYVKIGMTEGTVTAVGLFATKVQTGLGEEVSLPNAVVFSQPVYNYSRLVQDGGFMLHTEVTIGYATPWRQVHAMLLEAARRTADVAVQPAPYIIQSALSDFYVVYRLCAQSSKHSPRRRADTLSQLHANIQDVFNENGVQIMSPHYLADPEPPQVVAPGAWFPQPQAPIAAPGPAPSTSNRAGR